MRSLRDVMSTLKEAMLAESEPVEKPTRPPILSVCALMQKGGRVQINRVVGNQVFAVDRDGAEFELASRILTHKLIQICSEYKQEIPTGAYISARESAKYGSRTLAEWVVWPSPDWIISNG